MPARRSGGSKPHVPSYSLHKARGLACCKIAGKRIYLGKYDSPESREAYAQVLARFIAGLPIDPPASAKPSTGAPTPAPMTVRQLGKRYTEYARAYYCDDDGRPSLEFRQIERVVEPLVALFGDIHAVEFGPLHLSTFRDQLIASGLARTTINDRTARVCRMFKWAGTLQLVPASVGAALGLLKGLEPGRSAAREPEPVVPVPDADIDATLPHLPPVVQDMVRLQRLTGMRPGEVCALRPRDLDRSGEVWLYVPPKHKTARLGKRRTIFIGDRGQAILRRYLARHSSACCFQPADSEAKRRAARHARRKTPLSCGNRPGTNVKAAPARTAGGCYTKDSYARAITRACIKAGVPGWSPNQIRHTFATEVRREHGLEAAQVLLGHSCAKVTEIYAERDTAKGSAVARLIG